MISTTLDRTQAPAEAPLAPKALPSVALAHLSNGTPVHLIRFGAQPVSEVQLVYRAGHSHEAKSALDGLVLKMLTEGTARYDALALAQAFDGLGAFVQTQPGYEVSTISLSVLTRRVADALPLLAEVALAPTFPQQEWDRYRERTRQGLTVEQRKTSYHARRAFLRLAYGEHHPYAANLGADELTAITHADLVAHHQARYAGAPMAILVSGQFEPEAMLSALEGHFGGLAPLAATPSRAAGVRPQPTSGRRFIPLPGQLQATLRVGLGDDGRFQRGHADYPALRLLTTVLGGYFGSRLMSNVREEKGYTYGIHAQWVALRHGGHLLIGTDVANAYVEPTLVEIRRELDRLCAEPIGADELHIARNYLLGRMLSEQETPFQVADIVKNQVVNELPADDYLHLFDRISAVTAEELLRLAQSYLRPERLLTVVCGDA